MLTVVASAEVWPWTSPMQRSSLNLATVSGAESLRQGVATAILGTGWSPSCVPAKTAIAMRSHLLRTRARKW